MTLPEPYSTGFFSDPYPTLDRLRVQQPVSRVQAFGFVDSWFVVGYRLAQKALADPRLRKALPGQPSPFMPPIDGPAVATMDSDPPDHTRLRKLMIQGFTHHRVQHLRDRIQAIVDGQCDVVAARGGGNLIWDLAYPLPLTVMFDLLGVPADERAEVEERTTGLRRDANMGGVELLQRNLQAIKLMQEYFTRLLARKRAEPGDDLVSALLAARDGEDRLSEQELLAMLMFLLFAGYVTTVNLISGGIRTILDHPDQLALVRSDPALVPVAIEECLRYESPFIGAGRIAGEDMRLGESLLRRGDFVIISLNGANRDPEVFAEPACFDVTRTPNPHLAFGLGIHHCIGASLARLEAQVAVATLLRRFARLTPVRETADWGSDGVVRGIAELEVVVGHSPGAAAKPGKVTEPAKDGLPPLSYERSDVLDVAPAVRALQSPKPVRVRTPAGDEAWFVTRHADVKTLIDDPRLARSHPNPDTAPRVFKSALGGPIGGSGFGGPSGVRTTMRRLMASSFSPGRMRALRPRIEQLVEDLLEDFAEGNQPADLHEHVCSPLPVFVICELLGVPVADRHLFQEWSAETLDMSDFQRSMAAWGELTNYMRGLVEQKRQNPSDDVIAELIAAQPSAGLADDDIVFMSAGLLAGGFETTVACLDLGAVLLMCHPDQLEALQRDPALINTGVEEVVRFAVPGGAGLPRYAQEDLTISGVTIQRGEAVLVNFNLANRDPEVFHDPDRFNIARTPNPHLSFSHGARSCLGAPLARIQLQVFFTHLFGRFPDLRLAVPVDELRVRDALLTGALLSLPVHW